jgi:hypothetical protein
VHTPSGQKLQTQTEIGANAMHTDQAKPGHTTVGQRSFGVHENRLTQPAPSAANDNHRESPWPLVPFPDGLSGIPTEKQEELSNWLSGSIGQSLLCEGIIPPANQDGLSWTSWRATLGKLTYLATASIATLGWLYLLWLVGSHLV